jgi:hypothetical protein
MSESHEDRIGDGGQADVEPEPPRAGWREILAIPGLALVWPAGVVLLCFSRIWSPRQRLLGALLPPGGYAGLVVLVWTVTRGPLALNCIEGENCPPLWLLQLYAAVLTAVAWLWPAMSIVSGVYLAIRAWPASGAVAGRLGLVLAVGAGPVVAAVVYFGAVYALAPRQHQPTVAAQASPSPSLTPELPSGPLRFPDRTQAQVQSALSGDGFTCNQALLSGQGVTFCMNASGGSVVATGADQQAFYLLSTNLVDTDQAVMLFDAAVQASCSPPDAPRIGSWVRGHVASGGQTDIDGYRIDISGLDGKVRLFITRSRP